MVNLWKIDALERKSLKGDSERPIPVSLSQGTVVGLAYHGLEGRLDMYIYELENPRPVRQGDAQPLKVRCGLLTSQG